jgi:hypothetical protein
VSATLLATSSGRLALLVAALGLVLMHHVVGAHQHSTADSVPTAVSSTPVPSGEHGAHAPAPDPTSSAALLHDHPDEGGHDHAGSLLHLCLAALVGVTAVLALVLVASWCRRSGGRATTGGRVATALVPRAPPTPTRLAALQVLRL